eukprot:scaffold245310_cov17-Tisochrysis_lutea.AAC.1
MRCASAGQRRAKAVASSAGLFRCKGTKGASRLPIRRWWLLHIFLPFGRRPTFCPAQTRNQTGDPRVTRALENASHHFVVG